MRGGFTPEAQAQQLQSPRRSGRGTRGKPAGRCLHRGLGVGLVEGPSDPLPVLKSCAVGCAEPHLTCMATAGLPALSDTSRDAVQESAKATFLGIRVRQGTIGLDALQKHILDRVLDLGRSSLPPPPCSEVRAEDGLVAQAKFVPCGPIPVRR